MRKKHHVLASLHRPPGSCTPDMLTARFGFKNKAEVVGSNHSVAWGGRFHIYLPTSPFCASNALRPTKRYLAWIIYTKGGQNAASEINQLKNLQAQGLVHPTSSLHLLRRYVGRTKVLLQYGNLPNDNLILLLLGAWLANALHQLEKLLPSRKPFQCKQHKPCHVKHETLPPFPTFLHCGPCLAQVATAHALHLASTTFSQFPSQRVTNHLFACHRSRHGTGPVCD